MQPTLEAILKHIQRLEKRREILRKSLSKKGYSIKTINGNEYVYTWYYDGGKKRWKYLGPLGLFDLKAIRHKEVKVILEEIKKIDEVLKEVEKKLREIEEILGVLRSNI